MKKIGISSDNLKIYAKKEQESDGWVCFSFHIGEWIDLGEFIVSMDEKNMDEKIADWDKIRRELENPAFWETMDDREDGDTLHIISPGRYYFSRPAPFPTQVKTADISEKQWRDNQKWKKRNPEGALLAIWYPRSEHVQLLRVAGGRYEGPGEECEYPQEVGQSSVMVYGPGGDDIRLDLNWY